MIYCVEQYKAAKKLNGKQVSEFFSRYHVWDYIYSCFEALHTTGSNYIRKACTIPSSNQHSTGFLYLQFPACQPV